MTPEEHDRRATELAEHAVEEIHFDRLSAELLLKAAEIHARLAASGKSPSCDEEGK